MSALNYTKNNPNPNPTHLILRLDDDWDDDPHYSLDLKQINTRTTPKLLKNLTIDEIHGSCNGLILANDSDNNNLCLINPTTRKILKIPDSVGESSDNEKYVVGYDSSTDDYKVIYISYLGIPDFVPDSAVARVYSLRNNSWNILPNFPYQHDDYYLPWVLLNDNLHWVVTSRHSTKMAIAVFSLADEEFHEIEFPNSVDHDRATCSGLCVLGGKLAAFIDEFEDGLWVMDQYGVPKSWTKLCIIEDNVYPNFEFFAQLSTRDILLGNNHANEISIYNMDEKRFTRVTVEGCQEGFTVYGTYVESLESFERFR
ncbi:F-box/kelch-repeat protein At3g06240-like [Rutidosis leptorrhynchoides]|uniref:F-box/kelch-repeat protein At3g06240-like n=1 Tax=Rutidosis leptorrhynchoides TaxID=125765 RepID=UPI003A98FA91